jgi:hypothetical protein
MIPPFGPGRHAHRKAMEHSGDTGKIVGAVYDDPYAGGLDHHRDVADPSWFATRTLFLPKGRQTDPQWLPLAHKTLVVPTDASVNPLAANLRPLMERRGSAAQMAWAGGITRLCGTC